MTRRIVIAKRAAGCEMWTQNATSERLILGAISENVGRGYEEKLMEFVTRDDDDIRSGS